MQLACVLFALTALLALPHTTAAVAPDRLEETLTGTSLAHRRLLHGSHSDAAPEAPPPPVQEIAADLSEYLPLLSANATTPADKILRAYAKPNNVTNQYSFTEHGLAHLLGLLALRFNQSTAVSAHPVPITSELSAEQIVAAYGSAAGLNATALTDATLAILACQVDQSCLLTGIAPHDAATTASSTDDAGTNQYAWLKWTSGVVVFVEALLGVCIPILMRMRVNVLNSAVLSLLNCFTAGVFLTFGVMHLAPDAASAADATDMDYPIAYLFIMLGYYLLFCLQKLVAPLLAQRKGAEVPEAQGIPMGCCQPPILLQEPEYNKMDAGGLDAGLKAEAAISASESGSDAGSDSAAAAPQGWRVWVTPSLLFLAFCIHGVLEGLALGLQTDKGGIITVLVALVTHKWVESIALATRCTKVGAKLWQVLACLIPFALVVPLGIGIGAAVSHDVNPWVDIVLFGLVAGCFIYVGAYEIVHEEFAGSNVSNKLWRVAQFTAVCLGFVLVALLQLVHDG